MADQKSVSNNVEYFWNQIADLLSAEINFFYATAFLFLAIKKLK